MFIVVHNGAPLWGGGEIAVSRLLVGLAGRGHRVLLLCNKTQVAEQAQALGVPTEVVPLGGDLAVQGPVRLAARLRQLRPDAFIVTTFRKLGPAAIGARLANVPRVVLRIGLEKDPQLRWKYRFILRRWVDAVVVNAAVMREPYLAVPGWGDEQVVTIYNGVRTPTASSSPGVLRQRLGIPQHAPVVGAVARLVEQKRLDRLLRAVGMLPASLHCVIAGEGDRRADLEALTQELGIAARVHFLGWRREVGDVLEAIDVLALTSEREGMSNAMLEAMMAGVPVVSTPVSGAQEALDPFPDGRRPGVVSGFKEAEIAAALQGLVSSPQLLADMSAAARERAQERFGFDRMLSRWEQVLDGLSRAPRPAHS